MAQVVVMPQLGNTVESCLITAWQVKVGDSVDAGTVLCDIETDKSAMDVPAGVSGTVLALLVAEGDDVPVKSPIVVIGEPGEDISAFTTGPVAPAETARDAAATADAPAVAASSPAATEAPAGAVAGAGAPSSPRARALAADKGVPLAAVPTGSGPHGRVIARDVQAVLDAGPGLTVGAAHGDAAGWTPAATGTGIGGRVTRADLAGTASTEVAVAGATIDVPVSAVAEYPGVYTDTPLKGIRKIVSDRMHASMAAHAQLSFDSSAPAGKLLALRARLKASNPDLGLNQITIGDLVCIAAVRTAQKYPSINAHLSGGVLRSFDEVHLGLAVDTPRGLLVPTIRFASRLGLKEFAARSKALAAEANAGTISPDLLTGATFTVSNLGAYGIESFTPILNSPQTGILGVNAITPRPAIHADGSFGVEQRISFSLTVDHAVVDGADAARYLKDLCALIADIDITVIG